MNSILTKARDGMTYISHDSILLGMDAYEIQTVSPEILEQAIQQPGHYTVKLKPTQSKKHLHDYGFYYCDTLIEPYCTKEKFIYHEDKSAEFKLESNIHDLLAISQNVFIYGRFHRDFNLAKHLAENRYAHFIKELHADRNIYSLYYEQDLAGFIGIVKNKLVLHALSPKYQGKGLASFFWSKVCAHRYLFGETELLSSISAANLAAVNLYASLGFNFRNALDVYHRLVK